MPLTEARDRGVIGPPVGRDHPERDVLDARPLDHPRGPLTARVRVDQQRHHHRRIMRRATVPVRAVVGIERVQIELLDGRDHEPGEVISRQPIIHARRQQEDLLAIAPQEVLRHPRILLTPPDGTAHGFMQQPPWKAIVAARLLLSTNAAAGWESIARAADAWSSSASGVIADWL